jgi:hypothetical protein
MKKQFFYNPAEEPSPEEVETLIKVAPTIEPELVTVVRMADEAGIPAGITRFLKWEHFEGDIMLLVHSRSKFPRRRRLPKSLVHYLNGLQRSGPCICPRLSEHGRISNLYKSLWKTIKNNISARSLVLKWEREHSNELKMEEIDAILEHLAADFLTKAQQIAIQLTMEVLLRRPPTRRSHRLRDRQEILADF